MAPVLLCPLRLTTLPISLEDAPRSTTARPYHQRSTRTVRGTLYDTMHSPHKRPDLLCFQMNHLFFPGHLMQEALQSSQAGQLSVSVSTLELVTY